MNANELAKDRADILADELLAYHNKGVCGRAAKMLRQFGLAESIIKQQQLEIEALKKQLDTRTKELIGASFYEHDYKTMMANNEPVAWMDYLEHSDVYDLNVSGRGIPLYTYPVKELTDEEIFKMALEQYGHSVGLYGNHIGFARAILRKAQDK
jgi:hypothetical protein